jgi:hypothetical protein
MPTMRRLRPDHYEPTGIMLNLAGIDDSELRTVGRFVDAITLAYPDLIFESQEWCDIVHHVVNEVAARALYAPAMS